MADVKISQLPSATTPLAGTEQIPLVQSTTTKQVTVSNLLTAANLGTPTAINLTNATNVPMAQATGTLAVNRGGTGTATPNIVAGTNISVTGTWPNQTVSATGSAAGNVTGPASSTDNAVVRFDNTTGQVIQNSGVIISDSNVITGGTWNGATLDVAYGGTGVTTLTGIAKGNGTSAFSAAVAGTDFVAPGGALGTPSSGTATNLTGLPLTTGVTGTLPIANGGTNATTAATARSNILPSYAGNANKVLAVNAGATDVEFISAGGTGTVTSVATGTGLTGGPITTTGTVSLANTAVTAGSYTAANITVDAQGRITAAANGSSGGSGTVTDVSVVSANGLAGTVATSTTTPAITLSTSVTGIVKGNGTALSAATAGTDYVAPSGALGTPSSGTLTNTTGLPLTTGVTGLLPVANGGTGTATPGLVQGTNVTITGSWPNQTINSTNSGTVTSVGGTGTVNGLTLTGTVTTSGNLTLGGTLDLSAPPAIGGTTPAAITGTTITASTKFSGSSFDASGSGGGALRTLAGANCLQWGAADAVNLTLNGPFNMNPANATISIAPTGTGTLTINPATAGTINNMSIGATTATTGAFTTLSATGVTTLQAGTVSLPALTTTGDTNTGIFFPAADTIAFSEGGAESARIDSSGNVLVGGTVARATTVGTAHLDLFNGTAPAGTLTNGVSLYSSSGDLKFMNAAGDAFDVGYRNIPQNSQSANYTLVLGDSGDHIFHPSADNNARTFTIPANSSVAFPIGTAVTFINMAVANVTIAITTDTMYLSSAGTTGSRTLARYGSATAIKIASTEWLISGSGLT
jgi:hypothetical protein